MIARLKQHHVSDVIPACMSHFGYASVMQVPRLVKIVVNMGVGEAVRDKKHLTHAVAELQKIAAQKPIVTQARRSIAGFKIREGWPLGCKVTLRSTRMYEFLDRLIHIYLPRIRDFRGLPLSAFDGRGNYSLGIKEQIVCPEIDYDNIDQIRGMDITIATSARSDQEAQFLLERFSFPFRSEG